MALVGVASGRVAAHEVGASRFDAPIPLPLLFLGAGATVAVTAAWLAMGSESGPRAGWVVGAGGPEADRGGLDRVAAEDAESRTSAGEPGPATTGGRRLATLPADATRRLRVAARLGFGVLVAAVVVRGLVGRQVAAENFATVFVWPLALKGIALVSLAVGSPWRALSPWRGLHGLFEWVEGRRIAPLDYPAWAGTWPAVVGFVAVVGVVENLTVIPSSPRLTAGLVATYAVLMVVGGLAFGPTWFERADFLEVLFRQFGRVAPLRVRTSDGAAAVALRPPWAGCTYPVRTTAGVALVVAMVYTVSFDGFTSTPEYQRLLFGVRDALGTGPPTSVGIYLVGLAGFVGSFVAATALGTRAASGHGEGTPDSVAGGARAFAPTVVPIAAGYELAHNFPYVVRTLGRAVELGLGAAGVDARVALLGWLSVPAFWGAQVLLVVAGHVVAVVAAHLVAVRLFGSPAGARRGHAPLVAVMVGYTVLSLWIVSRPVVA